MIATSYVLSATVHLRRETRVEAIKEKPHFISQVAGGQGVEERAKGKTTTTHHRGHRGHKETPHGSIRQGERDGDGGADADLSESDRAVEFVGGLPDALHDILGHATRAASPAGVIAPAGAPLCDLERGPNPCAQYGSHLLGFFAGSLEGQFAGLFPVFLELGGFEAQIVNVGDAGLQCNSKQLLDLGGVVESDSKGVVDEIAQEVLGRPAVGISVEWRDGEVSGLYFFEVHTAAGDGFDGELENAVVR